MNVNAVPDPGISRGARGEAVYSGAPEHVGTFTAVPPPPPQASAGRANPGRRVTGLVPAQAGAMFPLVLRESARVRINPAEVSQARASLRTAQRNAKRAEQVLIEAAGVNLQNTASPGYVDALKASQAANDLVAALTRKLAEMEASSASRPIRVTLAQVREPAEVADVIGTDGVYVCLHDGCKGDRWTDEAAMRRAHPSDADLMRTQQCHPYAILCEAPLDPLDPEGEAVGLVAPVGKDGTKIAHAIRAAEEENTTADEVADLKSRLADLTALVESLTGGSGKKGAKPV